MNKQQLKPLTHNKINSNVQSTIKAPLSKPQSKPVSAASSVLQKQSLNGETIKAVKYSRSGERSKKTIEHYDCNDFGL